MTRDEAYQILSDLIFKGFLTMGVDLIEKTLIVKTINDKEFDLVKIYSGLSSSKSYKVRFDINLMIYSLLIFNNENILVNREARIKDLYDFFSIIPTGIINKIMHEMLTLRVDAYDSLKYLEGFSYTEYSRKMWKILRGGFPNQDEFTGVPGTSQLGMNIHQESWVLINKVLDDEEDYNQQFGMATMITSASNPKGAKQIQAKHNAHIKTTEEKRERLALLGYIDTKKWKPDGWASPVDTAEDLMAELDRQMNGIKDKHDIFMEKYLKKMRENADARAKRVKDDYERVRKNKGEDGVFIDGEQRAMTADETKKLIKEIRPSVVKVQSEEEATPEDRERFLKKIGSKVLTSRK